MGLGPRRLLPSLKQPRYLPSRLLKAQHIVGLEDCNYRRQGGCLGLHEIRGYVELGVGLVRITVDVITGSTVSTTSAPLQMSQQCTDRWGCLLGLMIVWQYYSDRTDSLTEKRNSNFATPPSNFERRPATIHQYWIMLVIPGRRLNGFWWLFKSAALGGTSCWTAPWHEDQEASSYQSCLLLWFGFKCEWLLSGNISRMII